MINLRAAGPETFCPPFSRNSGFTERITFLEVSGEECLFPRSVCGIESTARANPEMQIYVYINTNKSNLNVLTSDEELENVDPEGPGKKRKWIDKASVEAVDSFLLFGSKKHKKDKKKTLAS